MCRPASCCFLLQPLRPNLIGTTRALSLFNTSHFPPSSKGSKTFAVHHKEMFLQAAAGCRAKGFRPKFSVLHFAISEDLFSFDRFSVLPVDFFHGFLKSSDLVNEFFGNVMRHNLYAKLVACISCNPEPRFSIGHFLVSPLDFLFGLFKSSNCVAEFFGAVRRNDFCAKVGVDVSRRRDLSNQEGTNIICGFQTWGFLQWLSERPSLSPHYGTPDIRGFGAGVWSGFYCFLTLSLLR